VNTAGRTAIVRCLAAPTVGKSAPACRAVLVGIALALSVGTLLSATRVAQAGLADWLSSGDSQSQKPKKTVKKAGIRQTTKKPTSATSRMLDNLTSAPKKMMTSSMSAMLPGKKTTSSKSRTVPRKLVSDKNQPSMLQRLFTNPEKDKPLTVTEWIAQPRPK
jgi:hypothetical protein